MCLVAGLLFAVSVFVGSSVDYFLCFCFCPTVDYFLDSINKAAIGSILFEFFVTSIAFEQNDLQSKKQL